MKRCLKRILSVFMVVIILNIGLPISVKAEGNVQRENEVEDNNTRDAANILNENASILGKMDSDTDVDYYKYTVQTSGYFKLTLSNYEGNTENIGFGWDLTIYDSVMNEITKINRIKTSYTTMKYNFKKGTVLYFRIENNEDGEYYSAKDVVYEIKADTVNDAKWEQEKNDSRNQATTLSVNKNVYGNIYTDGDADYYKFKASQSGYVSFSVLNFDGDVDNIGNGWDLYVYDSNMKELLSVSRITTKYDAGTFITKKNAVYYVKLVQNDDYYDAIGVIYELKANFKATSSVESEKNDTFSKANTIKTERYGTLLDGEDKDVYKFVASKSKQYKITFDNDYEMQYGYNISVCDSKGKVIKGIYDIKSDASMKFKAKKGKKYYITISHRSSWAYSYAYLYKLKIRQV